MIPEPELGSHRNYSPGRGVAPRDVTNRVAAGQTIGSRMWFHEDMVRALTNGQTNAGWTGGTDDRGRRYIRLTVLGVAHTWVITGERRECPQIPNTWLEEGIWPD
jgi:hypothetical protein